MSRRNAPDEGAFSFVDGLPPEKVRSIQQGHEYRTLRLHLRRRRQPEDWNGALLFELHRSVFSPTHPAEAGRLRTSEALYGRRAGPPPEQLESLMQQLTEGIRTNLAASLAERETEGRFAAAFTCAAIDHAEMLRIHPFLDGNGRWARIVTTMFLFDSEFPIGSLIRNADRPAYIAALDRCMDHRAPGDLANLLLASYVREMRKRTQ